MMSKNSFVNICKSRKRRKLRGPISRPQEKLFCPRTIVRYDDSPGGYSSIWVYKMCLGCLLSGDTVRNHLIKCNVSTKKDTSEPQTKKKMMIFITLLIKYFQDVLHWKSTLNSMKSRLVVWNLNNLITKWLILSKMLKLLKLIF